MEIEPKNASGQHRSVIRLNPSKFELCDWDIFNFYLYIICGDEETAKRVQKLEMPDSKYLRMIGVPRIHKTKANQIAENGEIGGMNDLNQISARSGLTHQLYDSESVMRGNLGANSVSGGNTTGRNVAGGRRNRRSKSKAF